MEYKELVEENRSRLKKYRKDEGEERFLESFNDFLASREKAFMKPDRKGYPNIFIFGAPRSGTTLLSQVLAFCLDIGYINNLIARFWKAPLQGIRLSKILLQNLRQTDFRSVHGVTLHLTEPHEFGYFWIQWLGAGTHIKKYHQVQWKELQYQLRQISFAFNKPVMYKNILFGMHLKGLSEIFKNSLFIRVERDPVDNGISILKIREERFGNRSHFWSLKPPGFEKWLRSSCYEQIAFQIKEINRLQRECIKKSGIPAVTVKYSEFCSNPGAIIVSVEETLKASGFAVKRLNEAPGAFIPSTYTDSHDYQPMQEALKKVQTNGE
jgi:hypothetical protein